MTKYSVNPKTNALLNSIEESILTMHDTTEESISELVHYMDAFPREVDFNLAQYGNLLVYYHQVREAYLEAGYSPKSMARLSDNQLWEIYKKNVGYVARELRKRAKCRHIWTID